MTLHPELAVEAVQFSVVPELVVDDAANPAGTLGTDEQPPPPPPELLEPPPQAGRIIRLADMIQKIEIPSSFFRREPCERKPAPINARPGMIIHDAYNRFPPTVFCASGSVRILDIPRARAAGGATVENVSVALARPPSTETGFGLKLQVGAAPPATTGEILHDSVTLPA